MFSIAKLCTFKVLLLLKSELNRTYTNTYTYATSIIYVIHFQNIHATCKVTLHVTLQYLKLIIRI